MNRLRECKQQGKHDKRRKIRGNCWSRWKLLFLNQLDRDELKIEYCVELFGIIKPRQSSRWMILIAVCTTWKVDLFYNIQCLYNILSIRDANQFNLAKEIYYIYNKTLQSNDSSNPSFYFNYKRCRDQISRFKKSARVSSMYDVLTRMNERHTEREKERKNELARFCYGAFTLTQQIFVRIRYTVTFILFEVPRRNKFTLECLRSTVEA